jgi:hypothetical protein
MDRPPYLTLIDPTKSTDDDLEFAPLPHYPWDERPGAHALTHDEAATALHLSHGNDYLAAKLLKVPTVRLTRLIKASPRLQRVRDEALDAALSRAESIPIQTLFDESADARRLEWASTSILKSRLGRSSPLSPASSLTSSTPSIAGGRIVLSWEGDEPDDLPAPDVPA